jgi:hypothetical protein
MNRVATAIVAMRPRIADLDDDKRTGLDKAMDVDFGEHFAYQETQARAHVSGKITADEAQIIYAALGETPSENGWTEGTDLATKVVVTKIIAELLGR